MMAVYAGDLRKVELLLDARADPDLPGPFGMNPLLTTAGAGLNEIAELLLQAKANPDVQSDVGWGFPVRLFGWKTRSPSRSDTPGWWEGTGVPLIDVIFGCGYFAHSKLGNKNM